MMRDPRVGVLALDYTEEFDDSGNAVPVLQYFEFDNFHIAQEAIAHDTKYGYIDPITVWGLEREKPVAVQQFEETLGMGKRALDYGRPYPEANRQV